MNNLHRLAEAIILSLQEYINQRRFRALIHFELEGCFQKPVNKTPVSYTHLTLPTNREV